MPKGYQNGTQIDAQTDREAKKGVGDHKHLVFLKYKNMQSHCKTIVFEGCAGCVRKGKMYQKPSNLRPKYMSKSIENQCKIHARKSDAKA